MTIEQFNKLKSLVEELSDLWEIKGNLSGSLAVTLKTPSGGKSYPWVDAVLTATLQYEVEKRISMVESELKAFVDFESPFA